MEIEHVSENCQCIGKKCTKCDALLCVGNYTKDKRLKSGLKSECRLCASVQNKEWRETNREYDTARHKVWNEANAEHIKERTKQYRIENIDKIKAKRKQYQQKHQDRLRENARQYYHTTYKPIRKQNRLRESMRQKERTAWKEYYYQNKQWMSERVMNYFHSHPGYRASIEAARRTRKMRAGGFYTAEEWKTLKAYYGYRCLCCGRQEPEIKLHADHVIPVIEGGSSYIDNIQPLCKSCNSSKGRRILDFRIKNT